MILKISNFDETSKFEISNSSTHQEVHSKNVICLLFKNKSLHTTFLESMELLFAVKDLLPWNC